MLSRAFSSKLCLRKGKSPNTDFLQDLEHCKVLYVEKQNTICTRYINLK